MVYIYQQVVYMQEKVNTKSSGVESGRAGGEGRLEKGGLES